MKTLLAINSSEKTAEIGLIFNNNKILKTLDEGKSHSEFLLQEIEDILIDNGLKLSDIDVVSVNVGPGSFTGIRIGISFLKAFMMSLDIKAVCVTNFDIIEYNIVEKPDEYYIVIPSNSSEVYYSFVKNNDKTYGVMSQQELNEVATKKMVFSKTEDAMKLNVEKLLKVNTDKSSFLEASLKKSESSSFTNINMLTPLYIKKSQAEIELEKKIVRDLKIKETVNIDELVELEKLCFDEDFYTLEMLKTDLEKDNRIQYFAYFNNELIGYINFEVVLDEINLLKICVKEEFRHMKIASILMEKMLEYKKQNNMTSIFLEVDEKNIQAIKLYEKFNFKETSRRKHYYKNGDDAINFVLK